MLDTATFTNADNQSLVRTFKLFSYASAINRFCCLMQFHPLLRKNGNPRSSKDLYKLMEVSIEASLKLLLNYLSCLFQARTVQISLSVSTQCACISLFVLK